MQDLKVARNSCFGAQRLGANYASLQDSLTPKDTLNYHVSKDYDTKTWQNIRKPFPFITNIHIPFVMRILRMRRC